MSDKSKWCPTMHGTMSAYKPEYRRDTYDSTDGPTLTKWKDVPWEIGQAPFGHPYPRFAGGVIQTLGLLGYAQAQAIAWSFAAQSEAQGNEVHVRVVKYEVEYDLKASKIEPAP